MQKSLKAFFSSGGPIPKPNLNYPGGSNRIGAYGYFLLVSNGSSNPAYSILMIFKEQQFSCALASMNLLFGEDSLII